MSASTSGAAPSRNLWQWLIGSDSRRLTIEAVAAVLLAVEAQIILGFAPTMPPLLLTGLLIQWVVTAILLRLSGLFKIFGPVMVYDLLRASRRTRNLFIRIIYLVAILGLACWVYCLWMLSNRDWTLRQDELSAFALSFFSIFMGVQFLTVVILTPAYVAGAISEEKERKTLEFLLATDLRDTEIVLGKFVSRMANLLFIVLAGLPVLCAFQYLGGVDPNLVLAGFIATILTATSLGAIGIFFSVMLKKSRDAIALTYIVFAVYIAVSAAIQVLRFTWFSSVTVPGTDLWKEPITGTDLLQWLGAGNPILAIVWLFESAGRGRTLHLDESLPWVLRNYAIFHGLISILLPLWATMRLRRVALHELYGAPKKEGKIRTWFARPSVGAWPVLWKEIFVERGVRPHWVGKIFIGLLVVLSFLPIVFIFWFNFIDRPFNSYISPWENFTRAMNVWVRIVGAKVGCLTLLGVAVRAAGSITGERSRNTFDEMLTTPLTSAQILFAKFLGSILGVRWGFLWLMAIWFVGIISGAMVPIALPFLMVAWLSFASMLAVIGLWCSMNSRNTLVSTIMTLLLTKLVTVGHWLVTTIMVYMPVMILRIGPGGQFMRELGQWFVSLQMGITPPLVLGMLAVHPRELNWGDYWVREWMVKFIVSALLGIGVWGIMAGLSYLVADHRFRTVTNRNPRSRRPAPPLARPVPIRAATPQPQPSEGIG